VYALFAIVPNESADSDVNDETTDQFSVYILSRKESKLISQRTDIVRRPLHFPDVVCRTNYPGQFEVA